mgnify:CR=1 FL=1
MDNNNMKEYIKQELEKLDRSIIATPSKDDLASFAVANKGSNDVLLMHMAINYGHREALENLIAELG